MADVWVRVDTGHDRTHCEDGALVENRVLAPGFYNLDASLPCVFAVADGVGGHAGAEEASYFVLKRVSEMYRCGLTPDELVSLMVTVDSELIDFSSFVKGKERMASTLTMIIVEGKRALMAHVGNTRLLEVRNGVMRQLTHDQTARQIMLDSGNYSSARDYGNSELLGFMGGASVNGIAYLKVSELWNDGNRPDQLILTTDGIHDYIEPDRFAALYEANHMYPRRLFQFIYNEAEKNGSEDDKTMMVIRF
ncbi:MAG: protein serine/threonine phosphatase 2C family protein [Succinivibrionaceae bacterium]|nr:protein serine/threonine phosphatase 2C family protein [Succinivibrionaceae bacterium]